MYVTLLLLVVVPTVATAEGPTDVVAVALTEADFARAATLPEHEEGETEALWSVLTTANEAEEEDNLFEGDIRQPGLSADNIEEFELKGILAPAEPNDNDEDASVLRNALRSRHSRWPDATVPYLLDNQYSQWQLVATLAGYNSSGDTRAAIHVYSRRAVIASAMQHIEQRTCVRFRPKSAVDGDYLHIRRGTGCYSGVGFRRQSSPAKHAARTCFRWATAACTNRWSYTNSMHALGFFHEQARYDRDDWVQIVLSNVKPSQQHNFDKYSAAYITHLGTPYDYHSVMHYDGKAWSVNGQDTIVAKRPMSGSFGNSVGLSHNDALKINRLYECADDTDTTTTTTQILELKERQCEDYWESDRCASLKNYCSNVALGHYMKVYCPRTCGVCSPQQRCPVAHYPDRALLHSQPLQEITGQPDIHQCLRRCELADACRSVHFERSTGLCTLNAEHASALSQLQPRPSTDYMASYC